MLFDFENRFDVKSFNHILKNKKYDYIIIGTGPAAIVLYKEILKYKKKNILLIEKGNFKEKKIEKINFKSLPINQRSRIFSVGGTSNEWSNFSSYFENYEFMSRWAKKYENLWPFTYAYLNKFYYKLHENYGFNFKKIIKKKFNFPFHTRNFIAKKNPTNFRNIINQNEIDLLINCNAETLSENKKNSYVDIKNKYNEFRILGKKIILCAGGLESVKIILKSIKYKRLPVTNRAAVGSYFMDHPKINIGFIKNEKNYYIKKLFLKDKKNVISYFGLSLNKNMQREKKLLNSYVRFEKVFSNYDSQFDKYDLIKLIKYFFIKIFNIKKNKIYRLRLFCEMKPNKKNRIYLSKNDELIVNYKFNSTDIKTAQVLQKKIYEYFSLNPKKEKIFKLTKSNLFNFIEDASHHMGGLIYSKNKKEAIVDKNLKILGTKNIYVCSSAIFPTSGSANPTMTICALSLMLAKYLTKD